MMAKQKIKYEPHPVSPERKQELRDQGFRIIDARFAPPAKRGRPLKAAEVTTEGEG